MKTKVDVLDNFFKEVWSNENTAMIKQLFVPDKGDQKTADGLRKEEKLSPDDFVGFQQAILKQVKNMVVTIDQYLEDGDWLAVRCTVTAISRSTGKPVQMLGSGWAGLPMVKYERRIISLTFFTFLKAWSYCLRILYKPVLKAVKLNGKSRE